MFTSVALGFLLSQPALFRGFGERHILPVNTQNPAAVYGTLKTPQSAINVFLVSYFNANARLM